MLLVAGNFMEPTSVLLILNPIIFPVALDLGIDPIHLGVLMVVNRLQTHMPHASMGQLAGAVPHPGAVVQAS